MLRTTTGFAQQATVSLYDLIKQFAKTGLSREGAVQRLLVEE
jgi:hypothetical protein